RKKVTFEREMPPGLEDIDRSKPMYVSVEEENAWCRSTASGSGSGSGESSEGEAEAEKPEEDDAEISHLLANLGNFLSESETKECFYSEEVANVDPWGWGTAAYMRPKNFCSWCGVPRVLTHTFCPQCGVAFAWLDTPM
ncbi:unnamed protein product, partial [Effrenium voratum]